MVQTVHEHMFALSPIEHAKLAVEASGLGMSEDSCGVSILLAAAIIADGDSTRPAQTRAEMLQRFVDMGRILQVHANEVPYEPDYAGALLAYGALDLELAKEVYKVVSKRADFTYVNRSAFANAGGLMRADKEQSMDPSVFYGMHRHAQLLIELAAATRCWKVNLTLSNMDGKLSPAQLSHMAQGFMVYKRVLTGDALTQCSAYDGAIARTFARHYSMFESLSAQRACAPAENVRYLFLHPAKPRTPKPF